MKQSCMPTCGPYMREVLVEIPGVVAKSHLFVTCHRPGVMQMVCAAWHVTSCEER